MLREAVRRVSLKLSKRAANCDGQRHIVMWQEIVACFGELPTNRLANIIPQTQQSTPTPDIEILCHMTAQGQYQMKEKSYHGRQIEAELPQATKTPWQNLS
jgi:hypothetical protein